MLVVAPWSVTGNRGCLLQLFLYRRSLQSHSVFSPSWVRGAPCPSLTGVVCLVIWGIYAYLSRLLRNQDNLPEQVNIRLIFFTDDYLFVHFPKQVCYLFVHFRHLPIWHLFISPQSFFDSANENDSFRQGTHIWIQGSTRPTSPTSPEQTNLNVVKYVHQGPSEWGFNRCVEIFIYFFFHSYNWGKERCWLLHPGR